MNWRLAAIAEATGGRLLGEDAAVRAIGTDSRSLPAGALFVALRGEQHDGHAHAAAALAAGASALLVDHALELALPQIIVADTTTALGHLARARRQASTARVVGITGSNGKTTVKNLLASILAGHGPTHATAGNFNNQVGLPLTLLAMPDETRYAVLEMGAGQPGDIAWLAEIARPDVGLVNNIAPAHLERLGSLEGVARTKAALYAGLAPEGIAIINADEPLAPLLREYARGRRIIEFGRGGGADVRAVDEHEGGFRLQLAGEEAPVRRVLPGAHNVMNALAAAACALALGVPTARIRAGLEAAAPAAGRLLARPHPSGAVVIDDSYNANPGSFAAAIATLAAAGGETVLVMGDMKELGPDAEALHAEVGERARAAGVDRLYALGDLSAAAARAFGGGRHFQTHAGLAAALAAELHPGTTLLVKGSRSSAMENVVAALFGLPGREPEATDAA